MPAGKGPSKVFCERSSKESKCKAEMEAGTVPRMELSLNCSSRRSVRAVMPDGNVPVNLLRDTSTISKRVSSSRCPG